jgi:hypothetical protein
VVLTGWISVYADQDEYNIIYSDDIEGLGEIASGTAIAAATSAVAAIAGALKQVKGLFNKGGSDEKSFQSETDNAGTASFAPAMIPEDEDAFRLVCAFNVFISYTAPKQQQRPKQMKQQKFIQLLLRLLSLYYQMNLPPAELCLYQVKVHQQAMLFKLRMVQRKLASYRRLRHG